jgi:hypothetical protein
MGTISGRLKDGILGTAFLRGEGKRLSDTNV